MHIFRLIGVLVGMYGGLYFGDKYIVSGIGAYLGMVAGMLICGGIGHSIDSMLKDK